MSGEPIVTITGNLTGDPDVRFTQSGKAVCSFRVAATPRVKKGEVWSDGNTLFYKVSAWDKLGENCGESLTKGTAVIVVGRLSLDVWEKEGERREGLSITADLVGPSLARATATVRKVTRESGGGGKPADDPWSTPAPAAADPWSTPAAPAAPPF